MLGMPLFITYPNFIELHSAVFEKSLKYGPKNLPFKILTLRSGEQGRLWWKNAQREEPP
jgi:hypothetical protein